jgi:hypothetical protein
VLSITDYVVADVPGEEGRPGAAGLEASLGPLNISHTTLVGRRFCGKLCYGAGPASDVHVTVVIAANEDFTIDVMYIGSEGALGLIH